MYRAWGGLVGGELRGRPNTALQSREEKQLYAVSSQNDKFADKNAVKPVLSGPDIMRTRTP